MHGTGSGAVLATSPIGSGGSRLISKGPYMGITELRFPRCLGVKSLEDLLDAAAPALRAFPLPFLVLLGGEDFLDPVVAFPAFVRIGGHGTSSFPAERIGLEVPLGIRIINELGGPLYKNHTVDIVYNVRRESILTLWEKRKP